LALAKGIFTQTVDKQYTEFRRKNPNLVNPETIEDYKERKKLGLDMLTYYGKYVKPFADKGLTPIKVEVEFEVAIRGPEGETIWCKCNKCWKKWCAATPYEVAGVIGIQDAKTVDRWNGDYYKEWKGLPVTFGGRIDCLMMDEFGRYWIYDWKTAARMTGSEDWLRFDTQITWYCWALWSIGYPVAGFIYAEMKKAIPVEPEPHKKGMRRLGCLYSVSKSMDTTAELYEQTVKENDNLAYTQGLYDDFIAYLKSEDGPKYHQRFQIHRNDHELKMAGEVIYDIACDITDPNVRIYPAPSKFGCQSCAFQEPCLSQNRGEDYEYTLESLFEKRERHYYETEKSTDKREGE
jgi:hypothetical protein